MVIHQITNKLAYIPFCVYLQESRLSFMMKSVKVVIALVLMGRVLTLKYIRQKRMKILGFLTKDKVKCILISFLTFGNLYNENSVDVDKVISIRTIKLRT